MSPNKTPKLTKEESAKVELFETIVEYLAPNYPNVHDFVFAVLSLAEDFASDIEQEPYTHYRLFTPGFYPGLWADFTWETNGDVKILLGVTKPS